MEAPVALSALESLPNELMVNILSQTPNACSLAALIDASPCYRAAYWTARRTIVNKVVLQHHLARGYDILEPAPLVEVQLRGGGAEEPDVSEALATAGKEYRQKGRVNLPFDQIYSLLKIGDFIPWKVVTQGEEKTLQCDKTDDHYDRYVSGYYYQLYFENSEVTEVQAQRLWMEAVYRSYEAEAQRSRTIPRSNAFVRLAYSLEDYLLTPHPVIICVGCTCVFGWLFIFLNMPQLWSIGLTGASRKLLTPLAMWLA